MSHKCWLKGCTLKAYKKRFGPRHGIDGVWYTLPKTSKIMALQLKLKVGDPICVIYKNRFEKIVKIEKTWNTIEGLRHGRWLELIFHTETGYYIYDTIDWKWCENVDEVWKKWCLDNGLPLYENYDKWLEAK